jgi:Ca2+-binding RTX toxin-like protein
LQVRKETVMATINGTIANDTLNGTGLRDFIYGRGGSDSLFGNGGNDILSGGIGDDTLTGGDGADTLRGGGGHDVLIGGTGRDTLVGGPGADEFVFTGLETGDRISDFTSGLDKLVVGDLIAATSFDWIGSSAFSGVAGQGRFANGVFSMDVNGDRVADFSVAILGQLHEGDISFAVGSGGGSPWDY